MKVLLFGHKGWIGGKVLTILKNENIEVILPKIRANEKEELEKLIINEKITHIISMIGRTAGTYEGKKINTIDYLEKPGKIKENVRDNLFSPMVMAVLCKKHSVHLTYMGTGCIFEYDVNHPFGQEVSGFTEQSKPNFFGSSYSIVKGFTDELMHLFDDTVLNVRIRMPITSEVHPKNFITKIVNYERVCSVHNSMTVLDELLPVMVKMLKEKYVGTINLTNPGLITHNEILEMYREIVDPMFTWKNFTIEEQNEILAAGRSNNYLDTTKLEKYYPEVKNIKDSVRNALMKMKN